jgi:hypothetical protein
MSSPKVVPVHNLVRTLLPVHNLAHTLLPVPISGNTIKSSDVEERH